MIDKDEVKKIAKLAMLQVSDKEVGRLEEQFTKILGYFKSLEKVDTSQVQPLRNPVELQSPLREDVVEKELSVDEILENAPDRKGALFKVPPVV